MGTTNPTARVFKASNPTAGGSEVALGSAETTCEDQGVRTVTVAFGSQGVPVCKDQGVIPADARGTAQKASVPVRDPVCEVGTSKVNPEFKGEELKIVEF